MKSIVYLISFLSFSVPALSQSDDPIEIIDSVYNKLAGIKAYEADATIEVDVDFIRMPIKNAHFAYRAPDSFDVQTDGFLMIPKIGMKPITKQLDRSRYQAVYRGKEELNGVSHEVINMLPHKRTDRVVLSTFWIDPVSYHVSRIETFTKSNGSYLIDMQYDDQILPSVLTISFEIEGMNIPLKYFGNDVEVDKKEMKSQEVSSGKVIVRFSELTIEN